MLFLGGIEAQSRQLFLFSSQAFQFTIVLTPSRSDDKRGLADRNTREMRNEFQPVAGSEFVHEFGAVNLDGAGADL